MGVNSECASASLVNDLALFSHTSPRPSLSDLPDEVLLLLADVSDIPAIIALRQTCRRLVNVTQDVSLWMNIARRQYRRQPMIRAYESDRWLHSLSLRDLEYLTIPAYYVQERWLRTRSQSLRTLPRWHTDALIAMHLFRERWLVTLSSEGQVELWDLLLHGSASRRGVLLLPGHMWTSCVARSSSSGDTIILAAARTEATSTIFVITINLIDANGGVGLIDLNPTARLECPFAANLWDIGIGSTGTSVIYSCSAGIVLEDWDTKARTIVATRTANDLDQLWNGIVNVRICGPQVLCIRIRSLELYSLSDLQHVTGPVLAEAFSTRARIYPLATYRFPERNTFRHASSSSYSEKTHSLLLLLSDTLNGMYLYEVYIGPHSGDFKVFLQGEHTLSNKEGFVGAFALGPEGKKGLWIERRRVNTQRNVVAFTCAVSSNEVDRGGLMTDGRAAPLEKNTVYESRSYDLREDLIHCTLSEASGRIVMGTRAGEIQVLECWRPPCLREL